MLHRDPAFDISNALRKMWCPSFGIQNIVEGCPESTGFFKECPKFAFTEPAQFLALFCLAAFGPIRLNKKIAACQPGVRSVLRSIAGSMPAQLLPFKLVAKLRFRGTC